jgi:hypothetical protein
MRELAQQDVLSRELYDKFEFAYDKVWDHDMLRGCSCDPGYYSPNCGQSKCVFADGVCW